MLTAHGWIFDFLSHDNCAKQERDMNIPPCIHGNLCRQYIREGHGILRETCPRCEFYKPEVDGFRGVQ